MSEYAPGPDQDPDHPHINMNGRCNNCRRAWDDHCFGHTKSSRPVCPPLGAPACGPFPT